MAVQIKPVYYISGPMTDLPEFNYPAFEAAKQFLEGKGMDVRSPHDIDKYLSEEEQAWARTLMGQEKWSFYMIRAIRIQLDCTAWIGLTGWTHSRGARREFDIALDLGHDTFMLSGEMPFFDEPFLIRMH